MNIWNDNGLLNEESFEYLNMEAFYWAFDYIFCYECGKGRGTHYILLHLLIFYLSLFCLLFSHLFISDYRGIGHYYLIFVKMLDNFLFCEGFLDFCRLMLMLLTFYLFATTIFQFKPPRATFLHCKSHII